MSATISPPDTDVHACETADDFAAWDAYLYGAPEAHYFQTYGWLRSYEPMALEPHVLVCRSGGKIVGGVGYLRGRIPGIGRAIAIVPHGPVPSDPQSPVWNLLMQFLDERLRAQRTVYAQIYPHERSEESALVGRLAEIGYTEPPLFTSHRFSSTPVIVHLAGRSEDDVLASLRKNTRYYVRQALQGGLELRTDVDAKRFDEIYDVLRENGHLLGYDPRPHKSLRAAWEWFAPRGSATFLQAWHGDELAGVVLVVFTGRTAYYLAGAVRRAHRERLPAEFLHWSAIRESLRRGMDRYDMVNLVSPGVERFKRGFRPDVWDWHEPRTKVYAPGLARILHLLEARLRPWIRRVGRWRAARGGGAAQPDSGGAAEET